MSLALATSLLIASPAGGAGHDGLTLAGHFGVIALENASTSRSAAPELGLSLRHGFGPLELEVGYRGALRDAGTELVGVWTTLHRLEAGPRWARGLGRAHLGVALLGVAYLETTRLRGPGAGDETFTTLGTGGSLRLEAGVRAGEGTVAFVTLGATTRRAYVDLLAAIGVTLEL